MNEREFTHEEAMYFLASTDLVIMKAAELMAEKAGLLPSGLKVKREFARGVVRDHEKGRTVTGSVPAQVAPMKDDGSTEVPFPREMTFTASDTIHNNHALALAELEAERLGHKVTERVLREDIDRLRAEVHTANTRAASRESAIKEARDIGAMLGRDLDAAKALLRKMAEHFNKKVFPDTEWGNRAANLIVRARELTND